MTYYRDRKIRKNQTETMVFPLKDKWFHLLSNFNVKEDLKDALWKEVFMHYTQKNRHYHNLYHVEDLLQQAEQFSSELEDYELMQFSIWYHDIIYKATRKDNELKSAQLAFHRLKEIDLEKKRIESCYQQIIATKTHQVDSKAEDIQFLLDFDLAILGRPWEQYVDYTRKIRKEYWMYPSFLYKRGRKKVLQHFLNLKRIFKTHHYYSKYEEQARANLTKEFLLLT